MIQLQTLNYILDSKDPSFISFNNLNDEFFSDYKDEFNFIKEHINKHGIVPDAESFMSKFNSFDIIKVNETASYLIEELYKDKNTRTIAKAFNKVRDLINTGNIEDAQKLFITASEQVSKAIPMQCIDILKDKSRYDAYVERATDFSKYYLKTGFKELDDLTGGWDRTEELATIVARPGVGKSWILLKCASAAAQAGLNVGIYSGEMTDRKVGYRLDTLIGNISNRKLLQGDIEIQNEYKKYIDSLSDNIKGSIKILTPAMIGGSAGVTALKAFVEKENLDALFVDQHSLLEDDRKGKSAVEKASNISKDLKNLQVLKQIPIIAVSQQNRASVENGPDTSNVAQSDRISQDSTTIIFLEKKDNILTLNLTKSRDSVNAKKLQYALDFDKGIFTYIPTETDGLNGDSCEDLKAQFDSSEDKGENVF